jgi:transcription elongation factor GreA
MERFIMTKKGNDALREELKLLKSEERSKIIKAIATAREFGDLKENAEYHSAKEKQSFIEGRINEIESRLSNAEIIDITTFDVKDKVIFGSTVQLENITTNTLVKYQIVGEDEVNIENGMISYKAPIARAIIGKSINDVIEFESALGQEVYKIHKIEYI